MYFLKVFLYIYDKYRLSPSLTGSAGTCNFLQLILSDLTSSFISQLWGASFESFPGVKLKNSSLITSVTQEAPAAITHYRSDRLPLSFHGDGWRRTTSQSLSCEAERLTFSQQKQHKRAVQESVENNLLYNFLKFKHSRKSQQSQRAAELSSL